MKTYLIPTTFPFQKERKVPLECCHTYYSYFQWRLQFSGAWTRCWQRHLLGKHYTIIENRAKSHFNRCSRESVQFRSWSNDQKLWQGNVVVPGLKINNKWAKRKGYVGWILIYCWNYHEMKDHNAFTLFP